VVFKYVGNKVEKQLKNPNATVCAEGELKKARLSGQKTTQNTGCNCVLQWAEYQQSGQNTKKQSVS